MVELELFNRKTSLKYDVVCYLQADLAVIKWMDSQNNYHWKWQWSKDNRSKR